MVGRCKLCNVADSACRIRLTTSAHSYARGVTWGPILEGEPAERAWSFLRGIADGLASAHVSAPDAALFWSYASSVLDDETTLARTEHAHERLAQHFEAELTHLGLFGGVAGAAWIAAHIADDVDELLAVVDAKLIDVLTSERPWRHHYDLISGLVGYGVYFADRETETATQGRALILDHLAQLAERRDGEVTWHTRVDLLPDHQREQFPAGCYDVGLAHGVAGVVALAAKLSATTLRDEAARWLLAQRIDDRFKGRASDAYPARTAWCYGDPGVTLALWHGVLRGMPAPADLDAMTARWMQRSPHDAGVTDGGLCHGAAGLAHICNRLYHATGRAEYADAARVWIDHLFALHKPGEGIANFLEGAVGIGLALLAALTPIEPDWDKLLLCDLPVR